MPEIVESQLVAVRGVAGARLNTVEGDAYTAICSVSYVRLPSRGRSLPSSTGGVDGSVTFAGPIAIGDAPVAVSGRVNRISICVEVARRGGARNVSSRPLGKIGRLSVSQNKLRVYRLKGRSGQSKISKRS